MGGPPTWPWRLAKSLPRNMTGVDQGKGLNVRENSMAMSRCERETKELQDTGSSSLCLNLEWGCSLNTQTETSRDKLLFCIPEMLSLYLFFSPSTEIEIYLSFQARTVINLSIRHLFLWRGSINTVRNSVFNFSQFILYYLEVKMLWCIIPQ